MAIVASLTQDGGSAALYDIPDNVLQQYKMDVQTAEQGGQQASPQSAAATKKDQPGSSNELAGVGGDVQAYGGLCTITGWVNGHKYGYYCDCDTEERVSPVYHLCRP